MIGGGRPKTFRRGRFIDILVDADTHNGNVFGMWHPDFRLRAGGGYDLNAGQRYLWDCRMHLADKLRRGQESGRFNICGHIYNGDEIDGHQRAQDQLEAITVDPVDQADNFEVCHKEFADRAGLAKVPLYFTQGTEYHIGKGAADVERIAKSLGAVQYVGVGTGRYSRESLDLDTGYGVTINFAHGIGGGVFLYRATPIDREALWSAIVGKQGLMPKAEVIVRSHLHHFVHVEHWDKHALITPCWELQTRFMRKYGPYRMIPNIGSIIVRVYEGEDVDSDDKVRILKHRYSLPPYSASKLVVAARARGHSFGDPQEAR